MNKGAFDVTAQKYLRDLLSQVGIKVKNDKGKVFIEIDNKVKELTLQEARAFASELLIDSTFSSVDGDYTYHSCRWIQNWCYDADITVKYERNVR